MTEPTNVIRSLDWSAERRQTFWTLCTQRWGEEMLQCLQKLPPGADRSAEADSTRPEWAPKTLPKELSSKPLVPADLPLDGAGAMVVDRFEELTLSQQLKIHHRLTASLRDLQPAKVRQEMSDDRAEAIHRLRVLWKSGQDKFLAFFHLYEQFQAKFGPEDGWDLQSTKGGWSLQSTVYMSLYFNTVKKVSKLLPIVDYRRIAATLKAAKETAKSAPDAAPAPEEAGVTDGNGVAPTVAAEPRQPGNGTDQPIPDPVEKARELLRQAGAECVFGATLYAKAGIYGSTLEEGVAQGIFRREHGVYYLAGGSRRCGGCRGECYFLGERGNPCWWIRSSSIQSG